jgi:hypothetical protein
LRALRTAKRMVWVDFKAKILTVKLMALKAK